MLLMHITITSCTYLNLFISLFKAWWRKAPFFPSWHYWNPVSQLVDCFQLSSIIPSSNSMYISFIGTHKMLWTSLGMMIISLIGRWNVLVLLDHLSIMVVSSFLSTQMYGEWRSHPIPTCWSTPISFFMNLSFMTKNFFQLWYIG